MNAMIVDDNLEYLGAATRLLEREGVNVVGVASNSADALRDAEQLMPDVVLVDIDLGKENGFELAERLCPATGRSRPVILISSYPEDDLQELIEASSAIGFVSKSRLSASGIVELLCRAKENEGADCRKVG